MFLALRRRLLLSYLLVIATILSVFTVANYGFFARSLYRQLDDGLITQAKAAAPSLAIARKEFSESLGSGSSLPDLLTKEQSLEWFDTEARLLAKEGTNFPTAPLGNRLNAIQQRGRIRSVFISVYGDTGGSKQSTLEGYVRVSQSTAAVAATLAQLQWSMGLGAIVALILSGIGGVWLTRQFTQPVERSFQQLQQFTADASHELRSPLTAIKTSIEVMLTHPERIHPRDVRKIELVVGAIDQMKRLIEDMLFLARADATTAVSSIPSSLPLPLAEVLQEIVEVLEPQIAAKNLTFDCHLLSGLTVIGNASELTRLFTNLLENALQYTPIDGAVTLKMTRSDRMVVTSIADTGIGIAPAHLPLVFDRFWRADKARSYRNSGTGLGLAIARSIAQSHGGKITLSSQLGVGSCFRVHLPVV